MAYKVYYTGLREELTVGKYRFKRFYPIIMDEIEMRKYDLRADFSVIC